MTTARGFDVTILAGGPSTAPKAAIEVDVGADVPVAFAGLRRVVDALSEVAAARTAGRTAQRAPEWNVLFPDRPLPGRDLFELADAPNQRRLFRESEQTFRVLNFTAHLVCDALRDAGRPLVLRNVGACDLVSVRGLVHAVQCARVDDVRAEVVLCDWAASSLHAPTSFAASRAALLERARVRMRAAVTGSGRARTGSRFPSRVTCLEGRYLQETLDPSGSLEHRLAAALLAIRACFFSTNHEGAVLAASTGLDLLDRTGDALSVSALGTAWDRLDDPRFDIPMLELDRSHLGDVAQLRALLLLHLGVNRVFSGATEEGIATFGRAFDGRISPELASDLHLYRALVTTKALGRIDEAQAEIDRGIATLAGRPRAVAGTHEAWLHNLKALTYFQQKDLDGAEREETLSLRCVDAMPGPSAAHLKTNLVSNFSVLYEAKGDLATATTMWRSFATLNAKLGSDAADKVFLNRLGALEREAGKTDAALTSYRGAFEKAETTGDEFHAETIAGAIARVHLDRGADDDLAEAARWYGVAAERARACGDAVRLAKDLAGAALAHGSTDFTGATAALADDAAYVAEAADLAHALRTSDPDAVRSQLPRGKSKLSRPFNLVNP